MNAYSVFVPLRMILPILLGVLLSLSAAAWAGSSSIRCFKDARGVTNCTNITSAKSAQAKPQAQAPAKSQAVSAISKAEAAAVQLASVAQAGAAPQSAKSAAASSGGAKTTYIYRYKQRNGVAHFTNVPNPALPLVSTVAYQSFDKGWSGSLFKSANWKLNREAYNETILGLANEHAVDPALVRAVIHAESSFNPTAVSRTGAMGLMQLMPGTAARFGVGNAFDPQENIRGGVTYLRFLLDKFNGDVRLAAAGYNAGEGAVMKYGGVPPYSETTEYVARVLELHEKYRATP